MGYRLLETIIPKNEEKGVPVTYAKYIDYKGHPLSGFLDDIDNSSAEDVTYDNESSGLEASNLQEAVDEIKALIEGKADRDDFYTKDEIDAKIGDINTILESIL